MTLETIRAAFGWCAIINMAFLLYWLVMFVYARNFIYKIHGKWFKLSPDSFDAIHYAGMAFFKLTIFIFNLVPYIALRIVG